MKKVIIGSQAAKLHFTDYREAKDTDYLMENPYPSTREIEYHDANAGIGIRQIFDSCDYLPTPEQLYTLKLSHVFWDSIWFSKTMWDISFFQDKKISHDEGLFELLYKDWEKIKGKKRAYLKKSNEEFFTDAVEREYVHDDIHRAVAYYDVPMFEKIKPDLESAMISKNMFENLSWEDKCKTCREEIYVTALERFAIPKEFRIHPLTAYRAACKLLVTSMTKGWFPKFIVMNWKELNKPDIDYVNLFKKKIKDVKRIS